MSVKQGCPSMKYAYFLLALLSASVQADEFFEAEYGEQPDHLTPLDHPSDEYDQRISEHLFLTGGELGRFISRPSFGLESCVSVYEKISDELLKQPDALWPATSDKNKYFITVTQAAENLWYSMAQNNSEKKTKHVEVTRIDREISLRLAVAIQRTWARMLHHTKYPAKASLGLDGTTFQLSVWVRGFGDLNGETWSPDKGLPAEIVSIGVDLANFARDKATSEEPLIQRLNKLEAEISKL